MSEVHKVKVIHLKAGPFSIFNNPSYLWRLQWSFGAGIEMPAIISGSGTVYFFEDANEAEQDWITKLLSYKIQQAKKISPYPYLLKCQNFC